MLSIRIRFYALYHDVCYNIIGKKEVFQMGDKNIKKEKKKPKAKKKVTTTTLEIKPTIKSE